MKSISHDFDRYAEGYEDALRKSIPKVLVEEQYFVEYKIRHVARCVLGKEVKKFLDFGCGIGQSLCVANRHFPNAELWGYDVSAECIAVAKQRAKIVKLTSSLDDLPSESFDVVFVANVFHHIPSSERIRVMQRCKSLLRDDGRIFMFEHNPFNPVTRWVFQRCPFDEGAVMLLRSEAFALAKAAGLRLIRSDYTLFFPRQLGFLRLFEPMLGWFPLGAQYCVEMGA